MNRAPDPYWLAQDDAADLAHLKHESDELFGALMLIAAVLTLALLALAIWGNPHA